MIRQIMLIATTLAIFLSGSATRAAESFDIAQATRPRIAVDDTNNIHAVFQRSPSNSDVSEIFYSKSSDAGHAWTIPLNISVAHRAIMPAVAAETGGAIDVVWCRQTEGSATDPRFNWRPVHQDICFSRSVDGGRTWTEPMNISRTTLPCTEPAIATAPDNSIHVVWAETGARSDIFYTCSADGGKTWSPGKNISSTPGSSTVPAIIACNDGVVHCAWLDGTVGEDHPDIYYIRKIGNAWTAPLNVSHSPRLSAHPWLACGSKGKIFLCWCDNSQKINAADIWCAVGKNGRFEKPINMSDTPGVSGEPVVAADGFGRVAVVWSDTSLKLSKPDIYARVSTDNGDDFSNVLFLTHTQGLSIHPAATLVGSTMILVWEDVIGSISSIKGTIFEFKGIGTGPVDQVNPTVHRPNSNSH